MESVSSKVDLPTHTDSVSSSDSGFMDSHSVNENTNLATSSKSGSVCSDDTEYKISDETLEASGYITKEMILEEEKMRIKADKEMEKLRLKLEAEEHSKEIEKRKYQRLQGLLQKSQFYSNFASRKLDQLNHKDQLKANKNSRKRKAEGSDHENTPSPKALKKGKNQSQYTRVLSDKNARADSKALAKSVKGEKGEELNSKAKSTATRITSLGFTVPVSQPTLLIGASLRDYQLEGLNWLKMLFLGGMNGILADEMGLGKTIQIISLVCHLYEEMVGGPFLIVAPLSTLPNWMHEFETFAPDLPVVLYHGDKASRQRLQKEVKKTYNILGYPSQPVIVTSFEVPLMDKHFLQTVSWKYIIVDEGHRLKNHNTLLSRTLREFRSINRMLLTGTPLQNNLYELWSLLHFLMPEVFDNLDDFHALFAPEEIQHLKSHDVILQKEKENNLISTLHKILEPFLLRRVKTDVNLNLPPKREKIIFCPLTDVQYKLYSKTVDRSIIQLGEQYKPENEILVIPDNPDGTKAKRIRKMKFSNKNLFKYFDESLNKSYDESSQNLSKNDEVNESTDDLNSKDASLDEIIEVDCFKTRLTMKNVMMMLRKISNHPYLVQKLVYPGSDTLRVDERIITSSGKMVVLDSLLQRLKADNHKVLIFSTFTMLLEIIEGYMELKDYNYVRLDGATKIEDRKQCIRQFNSNPDIFAFLLSTRAGGLGINLTAADTVVIFDSDWNPQVDLQAQDRCHRIGQTRPVIVYRLITSGTIDESIISRADAKRKLEKVIIQAGEFRYRRVSKKNDLLDLKTLKDMLDEKTSCSEIHSNGSVLTDEQWEKLLDRNN